jgi:phenylacetate-CoA ligase
MRVDQAHALRELVEVILRTDNFNARKLQQAGFNSAAEVIQRWSEVPFTTKAELQADAVAHAPWGSLLTQPLTDYTRFCQTSGTTTGQPMAWLDTPESWAAMLHCWKRVFAAAGLEKGRDRVFLAFSFGPFLGFWTAFDAAVRDYLVIPGGGLSSEARLAAMVRYEVTALCCTPTYAFHLGQLAQNVKHSVKKIIVAGEAGGSQPEVRRRIEELWGARVLDHHGMTEVGPVSLERLERPCVLEVLDDTYYAEVFVPGSTEPADEGELVLTTLKRHAAPLLRYRTGDRVRRKVIDGATCLEGGILGRCDDMVVVRGVNVYPSAVDNVVRSLPGIIEYEVLHSRSGTMDELLVKIEAEDISAASQLEQRLKDVLNLRTTVTLAEASTLPRYEFKARRWKTSP